MRARGTAPASSRTPFSRDLLAYYLLTFALSWAIEIPLALQAQGLIRSVVPPWLHYAASLGPLLAAGIVTLATRGTAGIGRLFSGLARWRARPVYWIVAVVTPCAVFILLILVTRLAGGAWPDLALLGRPDNLPALGIVPTLMLWTLTFGAGSRCPACNPPARRSPPPCCSASSGQRGTCRRCSTATPTSRWAS